MAPSLASCFCSFSSRRPCLCHLVAIWWSVFAYGMRMKGNQRTEPVAPSLTFCLTFCWAWREKIHLQRRQSFRALHNNPMPSLCCFVNQYEDGCCVPHNSESSTCPHAHVEQHEQHLDVPATRAKYYSLGTIEHTLTGVKRERCRRSAALRRRGGLEAGPSWQVHAFWILD